MVATVGSEVDLHAPMGPRELVTSLDVADARRATGARSFQTSSDRTTARRARRSSRASSRRGGHRGTTTSTTRSSGCRTAGAAPPRRGSRGARCGSGVQAQAAAGTRRRERERRWGAEDHRHLHPRWQPLGRVPHVRRGSRVPLRRLARAALDPAHLERAASAACPGDGGLGRAPDRHGRATGAGRSHSGDARRRRRVGGRRRVAHGRRRPCRPRCGPRRVPADGLAAWAKPGSPKTRGRATSSATSSPPRACSAQSSRASQSRCPRARARGATTR